MSTSHCNKLTPSLSQFSLTHSPTDQIAAANGSRELFILIFVIII